MRDTAFPACSYTPYGYSQPRKSQLGFNGEYQEALTGVYQLGNGYRTYSPSLMRFHSPDVLSPFGEGGANPYGFCLCDPINLTDPSGRAPALIAQVKGWFKPGKKLVADTWDLTEKSLFPRRSQSEQGFIEGRYVINEYVKKLSSGTPFIDKLAAVNNNLASHGDGSLSRDHADAYVRIAQRTKSGSISNTSAHVLASQEWMKEQGPTRVVGTFFNLGGALGAGVEDHVLMKTGKSLHVRGNGIRNGIDL